MAAKAPDIVLRHTEQGDEYAFGKALDTVERLAATPGRWELRRDSIWHHGDHRIFHELDLVSIQPRQGSALISVIAPKGHVRNPVEGTRHVLEAMHMVKDRGDDDDQYMLADQWCTVAFAAADESGTPTGSVVMATPWSPAERNPEPRSGHCKAIQRILDVSPTAMRWEGHVDDGLPHVRIDPVDWNTWNHEDQDVDPMEVLRAMQAIEARIEAMRRGGPR